MDHVVSTTQLRNLLSSHRTEDHDLFLSKNQQKGGPRVDVSARQAFKGPDYYEIMNLFCLICFHGVTA